MTASAFSTPDGQAPSPIVHIGFHKTGTTWFQENFYPYVQGVAYMDRRQMQKLFLTPRAFDFDAEAVRAFFAPYAGQQLIISEEEFSGSIYTAGAHGYMTQAVADRLHAVFPEATIVIFLREQISMVGAFYRQYVKQGGTYGVDKYLHNKGFYNPWNPMFHWAHLAYDQTIAYYQRLFGADRVKVFLYEDFKADNRAFARAYAEALNLVVDTEALNYQVANIGYTDAGLKLAKIINLFTAEKIPYKFYLLDWPGLLVPSIHLINRLTRAGWLGRTADNHRLLGAKNVQWLQKLYAPVNDRLLTMLPGLPLARYGYALPAKATGAGKAASPQANVLQPV